MRISDNMNYNQANRNIQRNRSEASDLQNQAASQKRINKPSDDPVGATRVLAARSDLVSLEQFKKNLNVARSFMDYSDQSLAEATELLTRAKELAIGQTNSAGANAITRATAANEVEQLHRNLVQVGNRKLGERFLFGGYQTTHSPFQFSGEYHGDDGEIMIEVNKGTFVSMNVPGSQIFMGEKSFTGTGDSDAMTAPQSIGDLKKIADLRDGKKDIPEEGNADGRFIGPGSESKGPRINQELKLENNDGPPIRGPASVGERPKVAQEPANESVIEPMIEPAVKPINIFHVLKSLEIAMKSNDPVGIRDTLENLDNTINQVVLARSGIGARANTVDMTLESVQKAMGDSRALASSYEDADAFQVFSDMNRNETTLKATLNSSGKMVQMSLLDFLR
jgi:flagellar hook-associated protein 3 FlgL